MKSPHIFSALLLALSLGTSELPAQTAFSGSTANENPLPAPCCSCVGLMVFGQVDEPDSNIKRLKQAGDGSYRAVVSPTFVDHAPTGTECKNDYKVTVKAVLLSKSGEVDVQTKSVDMAKGATVLEFILPADKGRWGDDWEFSLSCEGSGNDSGGGGGGELFEKKDGCATITISLGGCDCVPCQGTAVPESQSGSFIVNIPTTTSLGGMTEGYIDFYARDFSNPGPRALFSNVPKSFTVARATNGTLTSVNTGSATIQVAPADAGLLALDPNAFVVTHKDLAGNMFRTTTIALINEAGVPRFRMDSVFDGATTRHEQTQPQPGTYVLEKGKVVSGTFEPFWQETYTKSETTPGIKIHRRIVKERAKAGDAWSVVSDTQTTWEKQYRGWELTKQIIDPDGAALTSTWSYYQPGEITGSNGATQGLGRLKQYIRHDGYESFHTYGLHQSSVTTPYAGNLTGQVQTSVWDPGTKTETTTTTVNGQIVSKSSTIHTDTTQTNIVYTSASGTLTTVTHYLPSGQDFGGRPVRVVRPNGTITTHSYTREAGGGYTTVTEEGSTTNGTTVAKGTRTTTTTNSRGTTILSKTEAIGYGTGSAIFESMAVTSVDNLGRPLVTAHHPATASVTGEVASATSPAWTTTTEYSCCGVAKETDMQGISTFHAYDHLQRQTKTNRLGVTTETVSKGLTTETYRYAESVSNSLSPALNGTSSTLIAKSASNLAGTFHESWSPDPTSITPGALV